MINGPAFWSDDELEDLRKTFYPQAYETVEELQDLLLRLENSPEDSGALKAATRGIHTLKGDANTVGLASPGTLCHKMEDILSSISHGPEHLWKEGVDLLLSCVGTLNRLLRESESQSDTTDAGEILQRIDLFLESGVGPSPKKADGPGSLRGTGLTEYQELQIREALMEGSYVYEIEATIHPMCGEKSVAAFMLLQRFEGAGRIVRSRPDGESGDMDAADKVSIILITERTKDEVKSGALIAGITDEIIVNDCLVGLKGEGPAVNVEAGPADSERKVETLRIEASKVDKVMNLVGELVIGRSVIDHIARDIAGGVSPAEIETRLFALNSHLERTVSDLQKGVMRMRMISINHVFRRFPKMVRDLASERGKRVRLDIRGKETELDKGIVDALGEPLAHIVRNLVDHGIEAPAHRRSIGKSEEGVITMDARHEAARIIVEISDDGRGLDLERLKKKAAEKGFFSADEVERMSDADAVNLIFLPGLSTSETITETSGRGVGMDAVKTSVEGMRGSIEVESTPGKGTKFILRLPLTLASIRALLFEAGVETYAVPVSAIVSVIRIMKEDLATVGGRDTLMLRDRTISVIRMQELFGKDPGDDRKRFVLILSLGGKNFGLLVSRLVGQQEVVIKPIGGEYARSGLIAGASILGNGKVVLILDAHAIFRKAIEDEKRRMVGA